TFKAESVGTQLCTLPRLQQHTAFNTVNTGKTGTSHGQHKTEVSQCHTPVADGQATQTSQHGRLVGNLGLNVSQHGKHDPQCQDGGGNSRQWHTHSEQHRQHHTKPNRSQNHFGQL